MRSSSIPENALPMPRTQRNIGPMLRAALTGILLGSSIAVAQTVERPVPFDSARRVLAVSPAVAERLRLGPPVWSVAGEFREARLYAVEPGDGFVLVVQRSDGALVRYALSATDRIALGQAIDAAVLSTGRPTAEAGSDVVSEPAGSAFARRLTVLSAA